MKITDADIERAGYVRGVRACLALLAKWFFTSQKGVKECREEMYKLLEKEGLI